MQTETLIALDVFCNNHNIKISFITSLQQSGLIEIITISDISYIYSSQLKQLEKIVCFYNELDINIQGIETITHMLQRLNAQQDEIIALKNRLRLYELNE